MECFKPLQMTNFFGNDFSKLHKKLLEGNTHKYRVGYQTS